MSNEREIYIPPTRQFVTDEETAALFAKLEAAIDLMGAKWLLHKDSEIKKKV